MGQAATAWQVRLRTTARNHAGPNTFHGCTVGRSIQSTKLHSSFQWRFHKFWPVTKGQDISSHYQWSKLTEYPVLTGQDAWEILGWVSRNYVCQAIVERFHKQQVLLDFVWARIKQRQKSQQHGRLGQTVVAIHACTETRLFKISQVWARARVWKIYNRVVSYQSLGSTQMVTPPWTPSNQWWQRTNVFPLRHLLPNSSVCTRCFSHVSLYFLPGDNAILPQVGLAGLIHQVPDSGWLQACAAPAEIEWRSCAASQDKSQRLCWDSQGYVHILTHWPHQAEKNRFASNINNQPIDTQTSSWCSHRIVIYLWDLGKQPFLRSKKLLNYEAKTMLASQNWLQLVVQSITGLAHWLQWIPNIQLWTHDVF